MQSIEGHLITQVPVFMMLLIKFISYNIEKCYVHAHVQQHHKTGCWLKIKKTESENRVWQDRQNPISKIICRLLILLQSVKQKYQEC
jgi:hypothetical protein